MPRKSKDADSPDAPPKVKVSRESMGQMLSLYQYLKPYGRWLGIAIYLLIISTLLGLLFPLLSSQLINSTSHDQAFHIARLIVLVLLVQGIMSFFQSYLFNIFGEAGLSNLRRALFGHLIEMPMTFYSQRQVGELTSRLFADLTQLQDAFIMAIPQFLRQSIIMLGSMAMMIYISPRLTGVMVATGMSYGCATPMRAPKLLPSISAFAVLAPAVRE